MALTNLAKAVIINTVTNEKITVMYNPEEFKLDQGNNFAEVGIPGLNAPPIQYIRGRLRTLTMDLFFDTYESQQDVRLRSGQIVNLLNTLPQTQAPPVLLFTMGRFSFECVLVDAGQRFTMFLRDGTPVRATLSVRFQEYVRVDITIQQSNAPTPPTLQNFAEGQTLSELAGTQLGDPGQWRQIAEANNIDDPFHIPPGTPLIIPRGGKS
ncbi:peptidoglycan-binding protein [Reticulibacter mediterranei]|uniref:Peptidoglycan-binding protein n=1 Tax=Reticulibacter mediterranei TaxID=2778369 RepID=A0A8J3IGJ2_9CHLR|nr:LysM peptidoglycan-binding domain-containing protein [Reticulibacter mediterranei]GHO90345.1 peptidoglycan-binding protein [Reticulibacter mediterranei]